MMVDGFVSGTILQARDCGVESAECGNICGILECRRYCCQAEGDVYTNTTRGRCNIASYQTDPRTYALP